MKATIKHNDHFTHFSFKKGDRIWRGVKGASVSFPNRIQGEGNFTTQIYLN